MKLRKRIAMILLALVAVLALLPSAAVEADAAAVLQWPVPGHFSLSRGYSSSHGAMDINDSNINGANIVAAMGGKITRIKKCTLNHSDINCCGGTGTGIVIKGTDGRYYSYAHMLAGSIPSSFKIGTTVTAGTVIGRVGSTGNSTGPHLHFSIATGSDYLDNRINPEKETYTNVGLANPFTVTALSSSVTVTNTNANIVAQLKKPAYNKLISYGATIYNTDGVALAWASDSSSGQSGVKTVTLSWDVSSDWGRTLVPGTTYQYTFWANVSGVTITSAKGTFTTTGTAPAATVSYNANGGSGTMGSTTTALEKSITLPANAFTRSGYAFTGWNVKRSDGKWYVAGTGWLTDSQIAADSLTKKLYPDEYTMTLDSSWFNNFSGPYTYTFYAVWEKTATELKITKQPTDASAFIGSGVSTTVVAQGDGLTYAWYAKEPGSSSFVKSANRVAKYGFVLTEAKVGRQVYCVVTDQYGNSVTSNTITFTKKEPATIIQQPTDACAYIGNGVATTVVAQGEGLTYTWYAKEPGSSTFVKSANRVAKYGFVLTEAKVGRQVYCVVTDKYGNSAKTDVVTFYEKGTLTITQQPTNASAAIGKGVSTTVSALGEGLTYTWYAKEPGSTTFVKSANRVAKYGFVLTEAKVGRQVYCVVADKYGNSVTTNTVTFTERQDLKITQQPTDACAYIGNGAATTVVAQGEGLTYTWYAKEPGSSTFVKSANRVAKYGFVLTEAKVGRQVYCVVTDKYGNSVKTDVITFYEKGTLTITQQPTNASAAIGKGVATTVSALGEGLTYTWYAKEPGSTTFVKSANRVAKYGFVLTEAKVGRQVYCVVTDQYGNTAVTDIVTFTEK